MSAKLGDYVEKYLAIRDKKKAMVEQFKKDLEPYDKVLAQLEALFFKHMESLGLESLKTEAGTAYTSKLSSVTTADRVAFLDFVREHEAWHLLDVRPAKTAVEEYVEAHHTPPPGVNITPVINVNVRKS